MVGCYDCNQPGVRMHPLRGREAALAGEEASLTESEGRHSQVERATILAALQECGGQRTQSARRLGIRRRALIYKLGALEAELDEPAG